MVRAHPTTAMGTYRIVEMPEHTPTYTLDRQIAQARREMGEAKWRKLMKEWER